jgi:hypothetical protein
MGRTVLVTGSSGLIALVLNLRIVGRMRPSSSGFVEMIWEVHQQREVPISLWPSHQHGQLRAGTGHPQCDIPSQPLATLTLLS